ncbi:MAG: hypothetical protein WA705_30680 [Candidatus Ozemobacteraceae bacterium]
MAEIFCKRGARTGFFEVCCKSLLCGFLTAAWSVLPLQAAVGRDGEVYVSVESERNSELFRLTDPASEGALIGRIGRIEQINDTESLEDLAIAPDRTIYLFFRGASPEWTLASTTLFRQVFDGNVLQAAWGDHSTEHQDQRGLFGQAEEGRPIFRPLGAPHGIGPGLAVPPPSSPRLFADDLIFPKGHWYEIPNGSWYQSVQPASATGLFPRSYSIYCDRVEAKRHLWFVRRWRDGEWLDSHPGEIGTFIQQRLSRFHVSASLESHGGTEGTRIQGGVSPRAIPLLTLGNKDERIHVRLSTGVPGEIGGKEFFDGALLENAPVPQPLGPVEESPQLRFDAHGRKYELLLVPVNEKDVFPLLFDEMPGKERKNGRIILIQNWRIRVTVQERFDQTPRILGEILLGNRYFSRRFHILGGRRFFPGSTTTQLNIDAFSRAGGMLGDWRSQVPEFPDTFVLPRRLILGILRDPLPRQL